MNMQVITVDARNHGDSPHSSTMSYKKMAEDVIQLLTDLNLKKAILVGHSMGGSAMMMTALSFPHYVEKLVVVDISPVRISPNLSQMLMVFEAMRLTKVDGSPTLSKARKILDQQLAEHIPSAAFRQVTSFYLMFKTKNYICILPTQFLVMNLVEANAGKYKWRINLDVLERTFPTELAMFPKMDTETYTGPTLFIGGGSSDHIPLEDHNDIKKLFPLAEFDYINGASHWVHADRPSEFVNLLTSFINR